MIKLEDLKEICINCRNNINQIPSEGDRPYKECPYRGISNDYCEEYETIKKDLEVLEILKRMVIVRKGNTWYYLDTEHPFFDCQEDIDKVKEWLEK